MRNKKAKFLRSCVIDEMYGDELTKEQKRSIIRQPKFKAIYRRRKKNATYVAQKPILKTSRRQERREQKAA